MQTLNEIETNTEAAQFADEYNKLFEAFYQSFTKQKEMEELNTQLSKQIDEKNVKLSLGKYLELLFC